VGSAARVKARNIGREERKADRDADRPGLRPDHVTAPAVLLGKTIRLLPTTDGELRAADGEQPADPVAVQRYLAKAFGEHLDEVRQAMDELANRYEPAELNRIGFRLYEKFRPDVPYGNEGWGKRAVLDVEMAAALVCFRFTITAAHVLRLAAQGGEGACLPSRLPRAPRHRCCAPYRARRRRTARLRYRVTT
jgi:hypothetical protein